ncbi:unnamed protein product, partial [Mesorhabditis belari]|uniref:Uncharacterized protein n=1 Tax=Mesorhabditis belari TaxID=2138241 RepID=A0AAF3J6L1_9BILA
MLESSKNRYGPVDVCPKRRHHFAQQAAPNLSPDLKVLFTRPGLFNNFGNDIVFKLMLLRPIYLAIKLTLSEMVLQSTNTKDTWLGFHVVDFCAQFEDLEMLSDFVVRLKTVANYEQLKVPTCKKATDSEDDSFYDDDENDHGTNMIDMVPPPANTPRLWKHLLVKGVTLQELNPLTTRYIDGPVMDFYMASERMGTLNRCSSPELASLTTLATTSPSNQCC